MRKTITIGFMALVTTMPLTTLAATPSQQQAMDNAKANNQKNLDMAQAKKAAQAAEQAKQQERAAATAAKQNQPKKPAQ